MNSPSDPLSNSDEWVIWGVVWLRYVSVMGLTLLIHDTLLTLDDEIRLVWPGPLSWPKAMYYTNRYLSIITVLYSSYPLLFFGWWTRALKDYQKLPAFTHHSPIICHIWIWATGIAFVLRTTAATGLLCMRVTALYNNVRWIVWSVWAVFVIFHGMRMILAILGMIVVAAGVKYSLIGGQCVLGHTAKMESSAPAYLAISSITIVDLFLLVLTIVKAFRSAALSKSHPSSPIMRALLRHELLYFVIITTVRSCTTVLIIAFPPALLNIASNVEWGVESTLISRFFLNLRSICYYDQSTSKSQTAVSTLSPVRTHPFWRRPRQVTTGFSFGLGAETSICGGLASQNEIGIPKAESVDLDIGMELRTRQDEDTDDIQLDADAVTMYESRSSTGPTGAPLPA